MNKAQIDNSYLDLKIKLRIGNLPEKEDIKVLDLFYGHGIIWNKIKKLTDKNIEVLGIDKKPESKAHLIGDNIKYLDSIDIDKFDIIDLDAYGIPFKQLDKLFSMNLSKKIYFLTFISLKKNWGKLPNKLLTKLGYNITFIKKCPSLFNRKGFEKFKLYLAINGIKQIKYYNIFDKYYIFFEK